MTAGPNSSLTATARFTTFSGGDYRKGTSVLYHARDDEKESETLNTTQIPHQSTEQYDCMEAYSDLNLDMDMDYNRPEDEVLPSMPRRAKKVCRKYSPTTVR
jgi:hypothetical protein